jgi:hypothetical protein
VTIPRFAPRLLSFLAIRICEWQRAMGISRPRFLLKPRTVRMAFSATCVTMALPRNPL